MLVRIPDVSVDLYFVNRRQLEDAFAQFWTTLGEPGTGLLPLSPGEAAVVEEILRTYRPHRDLAGAQAAAAQARGDATFTLELDLPTRAGKDIDYVARLFARIDQASVDLGVTLPGSPEVQAFRRALFAAIVEQLPASP